MCCTSSSSIAAATRALRMRERAGDQMGIDPGLLMKLVSRNAKNGAQFTPQGVLRWPLSVGSQAEDVLAETRALLDSLDGERAVTA